MTLFSYKTIVVASTILDIMRNNKIDLAAAVAISPDFENIDNLEVAVNFLDKRSHSYARLTPAETVYDTILRTCGITNYFPEEYPVFAEANPEAAEHHESFFEFWKDYTVHRGWHKFISAVVLLINGQYYSTSPELIKDGDFACLGFPGSPEQYPEVELLIGKFTELNSNLGFDPCLNWLDDCKLVGSENIFSEFNSEIRRMEPSVMTYLGRIYLNSRPKKDDLLGNRFLKAVE